MVKLSQSPPNQPLRADGPRCHQHPYAPRGRPVPCPNYVYTTSKLDFRLNQRKQSISQFLIDNFGAHVLRRLPRQVVAQEDRTSNLKHPMTRSNRPSLRLEMPVSDRKQSPGLISNRPYFAFLNFSVPFSSLLQGHSAATAEHSGLSPNDCRQHSLIENDMHSHENACGSKQTTYQILIENEFHSQDAPIKVDFRIQENGGATSNCKGNPGVGESSNVRSRRSE